MLPTEKREFGNDEYMTDAVCSETPFRAQSNQFYGRTIAVSTVTDCSDPYLVWFGEVTSMGLLYDQPRCNSNGKIKHALE